MRVVNVHERALPASASIAGELIDRLASDQDALWPFDRWPPMRFDRPLGTGAVGGHGPIRYTVESYEPGCAIRFRFAKPVGFNGSHWFELKNTSADSVTFRHVIEMDAVGGAYLLWLFVIRPLHNALIEDALDRAAVFVGASPRARRWSLWVRLLRRAMRRRRAA